MMNTSFLPIIDPQIRGLQYKISAPQGAENRARVTAVTSARANFVGSVAADPFTFESLVTES
jgi:hypothetical protein